MRLCLLPPKLRVSMSDPSPYLYGKPSTQGVVKSCPEDFIVQEHIKVTHSGEGEHLWLHLRKREMNTQFLADCLADWAGVAKRDVAYAGLKDRHAVTEQWFSIQLPGKADPDFSQLNLEGVELLDAKRHDQKIRPAVIQSNRFTLCVRELTQADALMARWQQICNTGIPNYFGEQRFGREGGNVAKARDMFAGKRVRSKHLRGLYLSAARSYLFNQLLAERICTNSLLHPLAGDCMMLAGSRSFFFYRGEEDTAERLASGDIRIALPLWGEGLDKMDPALAERCQAALADDADIMTGLQDARVKLAYRPVLLKPEDADLQINETTAQLQFTLPSGAYATTLLRELVDYQQPQPTES